jgi:hypothetical protein
MLGYKSVFLSVLDIQLHALSLTDCSNIRCVFSLRGVHLLFRNACSGVLEDVLEAGLMQGAVTSRIGKDARVGHCKVDQKYYVSEGAL